MISWTINFIEWIEIATEVIENEEWVDTCFIFNGTCFVFCHKTCISISKYHQKKKTCALIIYLIIYNQTINKQIFLLIKFHLKERIC